MLYSIQFKDTKGYYEIKKGPYSDEKKEVVLTDGMAFTVLSVENFKGAEGENLIEIKLSHKRKNI